MPNWLQVKELKMFEDFMSKFDISEIAFIVRIMLITFAVGVLALVVKMIRRVRK